MPPSSLVSNSTSAALAAASLGVDAMATRASRARATTGGRGSTTRARVGRTRDRRGRPARGAGRANANANAKKTDEGAKRTAKDAMEGLRPARARDGTKMVASVSTAAEARAREGTRGAGASAAAGAGVAVAGGAAAVALARASRGKKKSAEAKVLDRYAKIINDAYDIPFVPEFAESEVYREVCKAAYASAMKNLRQNLVGASVLGHPLIMSDYLDARHVPEKSSIKEQELAKFIDDVVGETSGIPVLLPGPLERKLYTNGVLTGWTVFEDTLKTFRLQLFDREFVFEVSSEEDGMAEGRRTKLVASGDGYLDIVPNLSNQTLRKIAREELKVPPPTNLFPHLQENVAKVAVGMLSEALTMEAKIKGFTVEFALEPYDDDTREAFANISFSDEDRLETQRAVKQLIEVCVDEYMDTRAMAISSVFLPRRIERDTYINLLSGLFGDIGKEPVLNNLGFKISMRVLSPKSVANASASFDDDALTFDEGDAVTGSALTVVTTSVAAAFTVATDVPLRGARFSLELRCAPSFPLLDANTRTCSRISAGTPFTSRRLYRAGSMATRKRLRHLSLRSTALRLTSASETPSRRKALISAHCPRP